MTLFSTLRRRSEIGLRLGSSFHWQKGDLHVEVRNAKLRFGRAPGHLRDTFLAAIGAYFDWHDYEPEPTVEFEVNYEPVAIPISRACTLVWDCSDIVASLYAGLACDPGLEFKLRTYAGIAQSMLQAFRDQAQTAA